MYLLRRIRCRKFGLHLILVISIFLLTKTTLYQHFGHNTVSVKEKTNIDLQEQNSSVITITNISLDNQDRNNTKGIHYQTPKPAKKPFETTWYPIQQATGEQTIGYIYSAFMDSRDAKMPKVRLVVIAVRPNPSHGCMFVNQSQNKKSGSVYKYVENTVWNGNPEHHGRR